MTAAEKDNTFYCSFVSIHYIICECGETFPTENALKLHLEKEHPHKRERKEYKCGVCGVIYNSEEECVSHYERSHIRGYKSDEESESEDDEQEEPMDAQDLLEEEVPDEVLEEVLECDEMRDQMERDGILQQDNTISIPEEAIQLTEMPQEIQADMLEVVPDGQLIFFIQNDQEEKVEQPPKREKKKKKKKNVKDKVCEICGKYYASNAALKYHQRVHTGEKPYQCSICPKSFTMPLFLQIHLRTHTGERPYACPQCPKTFSNRAALMRHDRVHTGEKPYPCPMCDKYFTQSNSMKLHVTTVHLKQPAPYKSRNRKLKDEVRQQLQPKPSKSKKSPNFVKSEDVIKNGLEPYILGPLKEDVKALKKGFSEDKFNRNDEVCLKQEKDIKVEKFEVVESEILYADEKECYEIVYEQ